MATETGLVPFRGGQYSQQQIMTRLRQFSSARDQYEAQVEVREYLLNQYEANIEVFEYVLEDLANQERVIEGRKRRFSCTR